MHPHEEATIRAFFSPLRRLRWLESLSSPKRRDKILEKLNHCQDFDGKSPQISWVTKVLLCHLERVGFGRLRIGIVGGDFTDRTGRMGNNHQLHSGAIGLLLR